MLRRTLIRSVILFGIYVVCCSLPSTAQSKKSKHFFAATNAAIQYTGRIDFTNPLLPRFWQPGVYIETKFIGSSCDIIINDEVLWGTSHNYIEIVVDGKSQRLQTKTKTDTITVTGDPSVGVHSLLLVKNTEANIGYLELVGFKCVALVKPGTKPKRKIEFIGNSITCGMGSDASAIPCGKGAWSDQHNAYESYGAITARTVKSQYHLSAVSGIGLMHSCCNMDVIMPKVFDKVSMRNDTIQWSFQKYQPDVVTICLGQNDGIQDSTAFCNNYISFIKQLRSYYPKATIICLTSPMGNAELTAYMKTMLLSVVKKIEAAGDKKIDTYFFSQQYSKGCDFHPSLAEHKLIAAELTSFIKKKMKW